jgi:predicted RNA-binding Zn-ribbon protein involved in translation (DUF1610 family)
MDEPITYCVRCTTEIDADAHTCPACGSEQRRDDRTPGSGMSTEPPAGWQAARPPASSTGYTVENP